MLPKVGFLTDGTAQFPNPNGAGMEHVRVLPFRVFLENGQGESQEIRRTHQLPAKISPSVGKVRLAYPEVQELLDVFYQMRQEYTEILVLTHSQTLSPFYQLVTQTLHAPGDWNFIQVIDTQTISAGLGYVVQEAAGQAAKGFAGEALKHQILGTLPRVYGMFCVNSLSYLASSGLLEPVQAQVGQILGISPVFLLENGRLTPMRKIKSSRQLVDVFFEFIEEFTKPIEVVLIHDSPGFSNESRLLRDRILTDHPGLPLRELPVPPCLAALFGPGVLGLFILQV